MKKTILAVLLLFVAVIGSIAMFAPQASACWWLFGCNSNPTPTVTPTPVKAVCAPGTHRCTTTVTGCLVEDCVGGSWVTFRKNTVACEVTGVQPSCFPSRV